MIVLIAYASLYPFDFRFSKPYPAWLLTDLTAFRYWRGFRSDVILNVLFYIPLGAIAFAWLRKYLGIWISSIVAVLIGTGLSLLMEFVQIWSPTRIPSILDVTANAIGSAVGVVVGIVLRQVKPLLPRGWRTMDLGTGWNRAVAVAAITVVVIRGLAPYDFTAHHAFKWIPFAALIESNWRQAAANLGEKTFYYGIAVWCVRSMLKSWTRAGVVVGVVLLLIEIAQMRLPGRVPEVTDPILAVLLAIAFDVLTKRTSNPSGTSA